MWRKRVNTEGYVSKNNVTKTLTTGTAICVTPPKNATKIHILSYEAYYFTRADNATEANTRLADNDTRTWVPGGIGIYIEVKSTQSLYFIAVADGTFSYWINTEEGE